MTSQQQRADLIRANWAALWLLNPEQRRKRIDEILRGPVLQDNVSAAELDRTLNAISAEALGA